MKYFFGIVLFINSILAFYYATRIVYRRNWKKKSFIVFSVTSLGSALWSLGYCGMTIASDNALFIRSRVVGIFGLFFFIISAQCMVAIISDIMDKIRPIVYAEIISGCILFASVIPERAVVLSYTENGIVTAFTSSTMSFFYTAYMLLIAGVFLGLSIHIAIKGESGRVKAFGRKTLVVEIIIALGMVIDTVLPALGINLNIPASTMVQFIGLAIIYYALHKHDRNLLSIQNLTGYMYESVKSPLLVFDKDNVLRIENKEAKKIFSRDEDYEINDFWQRYFKMENPEIIKGTEETLVIDCVHEASGMHFKMYIDPLYDEYKDYLGYIAMASDMTLYVKSMTELEESRAEAMKANEAKSLFLANMSHEIRTPMNSIIGFSELALRDKIDDNSRNYFEDIHNSAESLLATINDILDISKIESGKMELVEDEYDSATLFKEVELVIGLQAERKGLELIMDISEYFPRTLYGDRTKLRQIIINLLNNGVKYTKTGHVKLKATIVPIEGDRVNTIFEISDTGIGIKEEDIDKVFGTFKRVDEKLNSQTEGTGLGLSISKGYIELMNGSIDVHSIYGVGTIFTVKAEQRVIDLTPINMTQKVVDKSDEVGTKMHVKDAKILAVDDTPMNLKVIVMGMHYYDTEIDTAVSGAEAIKLCQENDYDLILMDQMMPNMDGVEAMHHIRGLGGVYENGKSCKIVALTANVVGDAKHMLIKEGFDGFVGKPINFKAFENELRTYLPRTKYYFE